jgi:hypothetical protein
VERIYSDNPAGLNSTNLHNLVSEESRVL